MDKKNKHIIYLSIIGIFVLTGVFLTFKLSYNKVYDIILGKDIEQMVFTSEFVTKLVESEIENKMLDLKAGAKIFIENIEQNQEKIVSELEVLCRELNFDKMGISNMEGQSLNNFGKKTNLNNKELLQTITKGQIYISNAVDESDCMLLAAPVLNKENVPIGVLWGHYRVGNISEEIELNYNSHRYFQIIDDSGNYISDSNNIHSFARGGNIWKEMKRYDISDDVTVEKIQKDIDNGRSGKFHFVYKGKGRYVVYEPLGINNWYVFSVLIEEYLSEYVKDIERIFYMLVGGVLASITILVIAIGSIIYKTTSIIKNQNEVLENKNSLLFMTLKHTNDVPFEIDLAAGTIRLYFARPVEKIITNRLDEFVPENMLKNRIIAEESYESYKYIFDCMMNFKKAKLTPVKFMSHGLWDINLIYYEFIEKKKIIGCLEDYNEQAQQNEKIEEISRKSQVDALTTLYNREYFEHEVEKKIHDMKGLKQSGYSALFILDLDFFKQANDRLGHITGDRILKESALNIKTIVRKTDICGRLGGDEFVVFIQNVKDVDTIRSYAEKINTSLNRTYSNEGKKITISVSIGIAVMTTENTFQELYQMADKALYRVKKQGKNGYHIILGEN